MSVPSGFSALKVPLAQLSLPVVLKCGQSFRWERIPLSEPGSNDLNSSCNEEWRLCLSDRVVTLRQSPDTLYYRAIFPSDASSSGNVTELEREASTLKWIRDYFQLDVDLEVLYADWSARDPIFYDTARRFALQGGIRMLRQDPFENLMSFICSQNNHISRITSMVQKVNSLCTQFSPRLLSSPHPTSTSSEEEEVSEVSHYHPFPSPHSLSHPSVEQTLRNLGFGYRAKYIQKTAALLVSKSPSDPISYLLKIREMDTASAREALLEFSGVGPKVADCILLMSMDKPSIVPIDTHVLQIAQKHYAYRGAGPKGSKTTMTPKIYADISQFFLNLWGEYAGWAHSVMFTADLKAFAQVGDGDREKGAATKGKRKRKSRDGEMSQPLLEGGGGGGGGKKAKRTLGPGHVAVDEASIEESSAVTDPIPEQGASAAERIKLRKRTSSRTVANR